MCLALRIFQGEKVIHPLQIVSAVPIRTLDAKVVREAKRCLGAKNLLGGSSLSKGFDCSGLVFYVLSHCGLNPPKPPVSNQERFGEVVDWRPGKAFRFDKFIDLPNRPKVAQLRTGDRLIFESHPGTSTIGDSYTGIFLGRERVAGQVFGDVFIWSSHDPGVRKVVLGRLSDPRYWKDYRYALRDSRKR